MTALSKLRIFTEPQQGATYDTLLAVAQRAEALGFDAFFRSDHYLAMGAALERGGLPGPTDAWTTLAGMARETERIRLGTLVTSATFRHPGALAVSVAGVDQMSGGRVELGLGAGWYDDEHRSYGIPFPGVAERFDRLEEQLSIITGMWGATIGEAFTHAGQHYTVDRSPGLPKPVQQHGVPIIVGGKGPRRTPSLAARYAAEFNMAFSLIDEFTAQIDRVRAACEQIDRDPDSMVYSAAIVVCCGTDESDFRRRAAAIDRDPDDLRTVGAAGLPNEVADAIAQWHEAGAERLYLQVLDVHDVEHLDVIADAAA